MVQSPPPSIGACPSSVLTGDLPMPHTQRSRNRCWNKVSNSFPAATSATRPATCMAGPPYSKRVRVKTISSGKRPPNPGDCNCVSGVQKIAGYPTYAKAASATEDAPFASPPKLGGRGFSYRVIPTKRGPRPHGSLPLLPRLQPKPHTPACCI